MSIDATPDTPKMISVEWEPDPPPTDLIFDDGEPLESNRHRIAMNALIRAAQEALAERKNFFVGGNMFIYFSREQVFNRDFRGPDFFVVLDVDRNRERQGWVVWEEAGRYPDVIIELLSPSTASVDQNEKKVLYERTFKTRNYFIYDPFNPTSLQGWSLNNQFRYQPITSNAQGWLWSDILELWLGTWEGTLDREPPTGSCHWLRWYHPDGSLVLLPEEAAQQQAQQAQQQAQQAQQQAQQERMLREELLEKLRQRGIDPNEL